MKNSPYETISCTYQLNDIRNNVERLLISDGGGGSTIERFEAPLGEPVYLFNANSGQQIKPFAHPIDVERDGVMGKEKVVVVDVRPFTRVDRAGSVRISDDTEYRFATMRGYLHAIWSSADRFALGNLVPTLMPVYAAWISESLVKRLDIAPTSQLNVAIIAAFYYWCQCTPKEDYNDGVKVKLAARIAESTRASYDDVMNVIGELDYLNEMADFTQALADKGESLRLKNIEPASLLQIVNGCWYGTNNREIASVAVEYPPYLAAMVYFSMHDRGLRSAPFTKLVQRFGHKQEFVGFSRGISNLRGAEQTRGQGPYARAIGEGHSGYN